MNWLVAFVTASHADVPKIIKKNRESLLFPTWGQRGSLLDSHLLHLNLNLSLNPNSDYRESGEDFKEPPIPRGYHTAFPPTKKPLFFKGWGSKPYSSSESSLDPRCNTSLEHRHKDHTEASAEEPWP